MAYKNQKKNKKHVKMVHDKLYQKKRERARKRSNTDSDNALLKRYREMFK